LNNRKKIVEIQWAAYFGKQPFSFITPARNSLPRFHSSHYFLLLIIILFIQCHEKKAKENPLFSTLSAERTGVAFVNTVEATTDFNIFTYRNFYNGGGVAIGDLDNDGLSDLIFTGNMVDNRVYQNMGNMTFRDQTQNAKIALPNYWSTGIALADVNTDGWLDIYICNAGFQEGVGQENKLFINNHDWTFSEKGAEYGLDDPSYSTHAAFFDYDSDGDLDVYLLNNSFVPVNTLNYANKRELPAEDWPVKDFLKGGGDKLMRNEAGIFIDVSTEAGIYNSLIGFGLGITIGDINSDFLPDIYISNDFFERDYLYINQGDGTFSEKLEDYFNHISLSSMGADMADLTNDGLPEIFVTEMLPETDERIKTTTTFENFSTYDLKLKKGFHHQFMQNTLQLNNGNSTFSEIAHFSGVAASDWSWGALLFDIDSDGWKDIYVCNGVYQDVTDQDFIDFFANDVIQKMVLTGAKEDVGTIIDKMPSNAQINKLFINKKNQVSFTDASHQVNNLMPSFSSGAAYGDLDNDGDLDLVTNNLGQPAFILSNESTDYHYLTIVLEGAESNTFAIGSSIKAHFKGKQQTYSLMPNKGFQSSVDLRTIIHTKSEAIIDSVEITWPDGLSTRIRNVSMDTSLHLKYSEVNLQQRTNANSEKVTLSRPLQLPLEPHREDEHNDFFHEGLIMRKLSQEGPPLAIGDFDENGEEDLLMGGAVGQPAQMLWQIDGLWKRDDQIVWENEANYEDVAIAAFDCDGDLDLDLYFGSGGNHRPPGSRGLEDRLYINHGNGQFRSAPQAIPHLSQNTSVVVPLDFDKDGDLDLFVGARSVPMVYGATPQNILLQNNGKGRFRDATSLYATDFDKLGMVTDAVLINGARHEHLVVVGDWMSPIIFELRDDGLQRKPTNLDSLSGWWYAVAAEDLDQDGDFDLVLGNRGENFYFSATETNPAKMWVSDFDANGTIEQIFTRSINKRDMPLSTKRQLTAQIPELKKANLTHAVYATKSIQDIISPEKLDQSYKSKATTFSSLIAWQSEDGGFEIQALPSEVQYSSVGAIYCHDMDGSGKPEIILAGNDHRFSPQFSRLDGSYGHLLKIKENHQIISIPAKESGFHIPGSVRHIYAIEMSNKDQLLIFARNNEMPLSFIVNQSIH